MFLVAKRALAASIVLLSIFQCQRATPDAGSMEMERALQREHGDGKVSKTEFDLLKNYVVDVVAKKFNYDHDELGTDQKYWREENSRRHYYRARVWYQNKDGVRLEVYRVMINRVGIADSCAQTIIM